MTNLNIFGATQGKSSLGDYIEAATALAQHDWAGEIEVGECNVLSTRVRTVSVTLLLQQIFLEQGHQTQQQLACPLQLPRRLQTNPLHGTSSLPGSGDLMRPPHNHVCAGQQLRQHEISGRPPTVRSHCAGAVHGGQGAGGGAEHGACEPAIDDEKLKPLIAPILPSWMQLDAHHVVSAWA